MHPQIQALYDLQKQDRQLNKLERRADLIPRRLEELDADLAKLEGMLAVERAKCEQTRDFQHVQEERLADEEQLIRSSKARTSQVKTARELNAVQRELESTRKMAAARTEEIAKLKEGVEQAEKLVTSMDEGLTSLRTQAASERARLTARLDKTNGRLEKLRGGRTELTNAIDAATLRTYERIRRHVAGMAFVSVKDQRCTACEMLVPHIQFVALKKGKDITSCQSCGRLLHWAGHFPEEEPDNKDEATPKAAPPRVRSAGSQPT